MNGYLKAFLHRGALFGGFGPIIAGAVFLILSSSLPDFSLSGADIFVAIVSTYLLAFLQAGASVFNQIEHWSPLRSLICHFATVYLAYVLTYTVNSWIPFEPIFLLIFSGAFLLCYLIIYLTVALIVRATGKRLNSTLGEN